MLYGMFGTAATLGRSFKICNVIISHPAVCSEKSKHHCKRCLTRWSYIRLSAIHLVRIVSRLIQPVLLVWKQMGWLWYYDHRSIYNMSFIIKESMLNVTRYETSCDRLLTRISWTCLKNYLQGNIAKI